MESGEKMAYHELIKNFEKIRNYMRQFYVYGFKSRSEYPLGVIGSYLLDKYTDKSECFRFKHHYMLHALDSQILYEILSCLAEKRKVKFHIKSDRADGEREHMVFPIKIFVSTQTGRQYPFCYHYGKQKTAFYRIFDLIYTTALKNKCDQSQISSTLYLISDMEFDCCVGCASKRSFQYAKERFEAAGYKLPKVVFWNVASRNRHHPVSQNEQGAALVSGCTPGIFAAITKKTFLPMPIC